MGNVNYLIDLERSILSGKTTYWKSNKMGYTLNLNEAGKYSDEHADKIVKNDLDRTTVKLEQEIVYNLIRNNID